MLKSEFVHDTCKSYIDKSHRKSLRGLGAALDHTSYQTLRRVETSAWKPGKPYGSKRHSWNRRFDNHDFAVIQKTMCQIRNSRSLRNGAFSAYGTGN